MDITQNEKKLVDDYINKIYIFNINNINKNNYLKITYIY